MLSQNLQINPVQLIDPKDFGGGISCIFQDKTGFIWIGKETGLFRYDGNEFKVFKHDATDPNSISNNSISSILEDDKNNLWIGTRGGGLNCYNRQTGKFTVYCNDIKNPESISFNEVNTLKLNKNGNFWVGTDGGGLNYLDTKTFKFKTTQYSASNKTGLKSNKVLRICADTKGNFWIGTWEGGLHSLNPKTQKIKHLGENSEFSNCNILGLTEVKTNILWLATWGQGLVEYNIAENTFKTIIQPKNIPTFHDIQVSPKGEVWVGSTLGLLYFKTITSDYVRIEDSNTNVSFGHINRVLIDRSGIVWIGCYDGTFGKVLNIKKKFSVIPAPNPLSESAISSIKDDKNGLIYFSSKNKIVSYNPLSKTFKSWTNAFGEIVSFVEVPELNSLLCNSLKDFSLFDKITGSFKKLKILYNQADLINYEIRVIGKPDPASYWVGANGAAYQIVFDNKTGILKITNVLYSGIGKNLPACHFPSCFLYDKKNNFWIGSSGGGLSKIKDNRSVVSYQFNKDKDLLGISNNFVECMANDKVGNILIGTRSGLDIYNPTTNSFTTYNIAAGLVDEWITSVVLDKNQKIWLSTQKGISSISKDHKSIRNYDLNDGLPANAFLPRAVTSDKKGNLYFGTAHGMVWFHPDSISDNPIPATGVLVDFKVNNEKVFVSDNSPLKENIELAKKIELDYKQSSFSIQMAALSYFNPKKNRIKYKLQGYDSDWQLAGADQTAIYSEVPAGKYNFLYIVSNEDGIWSKSEKSIEIRISRPPWFSWWAITFYFLILLGGVLYFFLVSNRLKTAIAKEIANSKFRPNSGKNIIQPTEIDIESADVKFLNKAISLVEESIDNADFGVEQLCDKMFISRAQLYRKINNISGVSVSEFIKEIRLKRAAQLILQKSANISEIAYQVGFNDPKYFSKCFKQQFGVAPFNYTVQDEQSIPPQ